MITPLSSHTGAEVRGVDLTQPLDAALRERLNHAFVEHSVLVFRDQHLSPQQLLDAVQSFGEVFPQHNTRFALPECPQIHYISNQDSYPDGRRYIPGEGYHTDHSNAAEPPKATVLHAVRLPDRGGDTQFVNMHRAYEDLPAAMRQRLGGLRAVHVYQSRHSERKLMALSETARQTVPDAVLHPLVRTHPESGRRSIYLNPIRIEGIVGMAESDALGLLDESAGARDAAAVPVPPSVASGRHGDVGQPLPAAQGEWRLRHGPGAVSVPDHAEGRRAGVATPIMPGLVVAAPWRR